MFLDGLDFFPLCLLFLYLQYRLSKTLFDEVGHHVTISDHHPSFSQQKNITTHPITIGQLLYDKKYDPSQTNPTSHHTCTVHTHQKEKYIQPTELNRGVNSERGSAERATRLRTQPLINTLGVKTMPAIRQHLYFLAISKHS